MEWNTIIGQVKAKALLQEQLQNNKTSHAYLFMGPDGVGKRLTSEILAMALNCLDGHNKPCGKCLRCKQSLHNNSPYINYLAPLGANIKIDQIRTLLRRINLKTEDTAAQVLIIDGADKMTPDAANNLLKTLEEPPPRVHFILLAHQKAAVLPTIISRCQIVLFTPLEIQDVSAYLQNKYSLSPEKAVAIAKIAQGSIGQAQKITEDEGFNNLRSIAEEIFDFCPQDAYDILKLSSQIEENKEQLFEILDILRYLIRDALVSKAGTPELIINWDKKKLIQKEDYSINELLRQYSLVDEAILRLKFNANKRLALDALLLALKLDGRKPTW